MSETHDLTGSPLDLGRGVRLDAPGLAGTVTVHDAVLDAATTRAMTHPDIGEPLAAAGFEEFLTLELDVQPAATGAAFGLRGPAGDEVFQLEVPDLGEDRGQVVLAMDEAGIATWSFPVDERGGVQPTSVRGAAGTRRFLVRTQLAGNPPAGTTRGLLGDLGRKLLRVLVYPVTDPIIGRLGRHFARHWEETNRPYGVRLFEPGNYRTPRREQMSPADWERMGQGRALLFVHGTFSTSHGAFGDLPPQVFEDLHGRYGRRVFAFDHFTMSDDPERNVRWFLEQVPERLKLELDVVCHSRGGLVARALERLAAGEAGLAERLRLGRVVFVAVPNQGTLLADADHMVDFLDRLTTILNLFPPGGAREVLDAVLVVVKLLGHGVLQGLDGLAAMDPRGEFLQVLNRGEKGGAEYHAIAADYEPQGALRQFVRTVADATLDRVFRNAPNDLVVPSLGVFQGNGHGGFPVEEVRVLRYGIDRDVIHTNYFGQPDTVGALRRWLTPS